VTRASAALFLGASAMFANMYSTQAILPDVERGLHASPAAAGLTITVVVVAVAVGAWVTGPLSDRLGRARVMAAAAALICVPTALAGLAPNLPALLVVRACQGLLMPGLLVVAVPYVTERFRGPAAGAAMGAYTASLVFGGLVGRVGTALVADVTSWRVGLEALTLPSVAGAVTMRLWLPRDAPRGLRRDVRAVVAEHVRNRALVLNGAVAGTTFFGFVGIFTYATHRLTAPPLGLSLGEAGLVYGVWVVGLLVPAVGHLAQRAGPERLLPVLVACGAAGAALTLVDSLPVVIAGMALQAGAMFSTVTTAQLLIPRLVAHHRGTATSVHLTVYYALGGAGAYVPGLWLGDGWGAVVAACVAVLAAGLAASAVLARSLAGGAARSDTLAGRCSGTPPTS
jgi:MFS transporter, YNFM family, putative membrane transport protein